MPLPDATKDKRIYQLLKNIDLGNLTFSEFQTAAQSVFAEPEAEDTLRRIVLVNLARMSVAGDWTGLTSSGGGGGFAQMLPLIASTGADQYEITSTPPWNGTVNTNKDVTVFKKPHAFPFISPNTGTVSAIGINVQSAEAGDSLNVAIYSQDTNFLPSTLLGYAVIALDSTGVIYQTSISATIELTAGTQYWFAVNLTAASHALITANGYQYLPAIGITNVLTTKAFSISDNAVGSYEAPPSTFTPNKQENEDRPIIGLKF